MLIIVIAASVITPTPDIYNMSLLAVPLYVLYEIGILLMRLSGARREPGKDGLDRKTQICVEFSQWKKLSARLGYVGVLIGTFLEGETTILLAAIFAKLGYLKLRHGDVLVVHRHLRGGLLLFFPGQVLRKVGDRAV